MSQQQQYLYAKTIAISDPTTKLYWTTEDNYRISLSNPDGNGKVQCGPPGTKNQVWLLRGSEDTEGLISILSIQHDKRQPLAVTYDPDNQDDTKKISVRPFVPYDVTQLFKISQQGSNFVFQTIIDEDVGKGKYKYINPDDTTITSFFLIVSNPNGSTAYDIVLKRCISEASMAKVTSSAKTSMETKTVYRYFHGRCTPEEWTEYCWMPQVRTDETPGDWKSRIWTRLMYFRENDLFPGESNKYLEASRPKKLSDGTLYAPTIGIAICFSCMEKHWKFSCSGNEFCSVSYEEYTKIKQKPKSAPYSVEDKYAFHRYKLWMENATKRLKCAREVGRKIRAVNIIKEKWIEYIYHPDGLTAKELAEHYKLLQSVREEMHELSLKIGEVERLKSDKSIVGDTKYPAPEKSLREYLRENIKMQLRKSEVSATSPEIKIVDANSPDKDKSGTSSFKDDTLQNIEPMKVIYPEENIPNSSLDKSNSELSMGGIEAIHAMASVLGSPKIPWLMITLLIIIVILVRFIRPILNANKKSGTGIIRPRIAKNLLPIESKNF
nr:4072_t:CDS:2 [Entrophospora candida]